jgi:biopolymer transport protein ExbB/TolQ
MDHLSLSPLALFVQAGPVGKGVMLSLLIASLWCWVNIAEGLFIGARLRRAISSAKENTAAAIIKTIFEAGDNAPIIRGETISEQRQRFTDMMKREARALIAEADKGFATLAIIASIAPFIGLLGTVWGIMSSFADIAGAQDTSLAVVAPGIAEALASTAFGLAAAIPASIGYSRLGHSLSRTAQELENIIEHHAEQIVITRAHEEA